MGATHKGDLSASIAVLGLLSEENDTAAGLGQRLAKCFPRARFSRSVVHNTLPSLERRGLVRVIQPGEGGTLDRHALTPRGRSALQRWLRTPPAAAPALRDALQGKVTFAQREDLPSVIEAVREGQRLCAEQYGAAHARLLAARGRVGAREDWRCALDRVMIGDEVTMWLLQTKRLERLLQALERLEQGAAGVAQPPAREAS